MNYRERRLRNMERRLFALERAVAALRKVVEEPKTEAPETVELVKQVLCAVEPQK